MCKKMWGVCGDSSAVIREQTSALIDVYYSHLMHASMICAQDGSSSIHTTKMSLELTNFSSIPIYTKAHRELDEACVLQRSMQRIRGIKMRYSSEKAGARTNAKMIAGSDKV